MNEPSRRANEWALFLTIFIHGAVVVIVTVGVLVKDNIPTGFLALATLSLGSLCPKCMAAVLNSVRTSHGDHD